jgi:glutathione S-transferase
MAEVVLHQWEVSPFCAKVRGMLRHKGVAFSVENYHGLLAGKAAKLSPGGKLPVLDIDGRRVADSTVIARYLDERQRTPPLYPADPEQAALARIFEDWADESLYCYEIFFRAEYPEARRATVAHLSAGRPAWEQRLFAPLFTRTLRRKLKANGFRVEARAEIEASFLRYMVDLDVLLARRDWLVGDAASIADIAVAAQVGEVVRTSHLAARIRALPRLSAWLARLAE